MYQVYLYVWEDNKAETYSITLEGRVVQPNYNSGSAGTWQKVGPYTATITDGTISLATTGGAANFSGIEVWRVNNASRVAADAGRTSFAIDRSPKLFPNPAAHTLTVNLPFPADKVLSTQVTDLTGRVHLLNVHSASGSGELRIPTVALPKGFYLLRLNTRQGAVVARFARQ
jgi:hypothetical protein